ncbi:MAG: DNA polymerase III subunit epsilon [Alphaproteobacteria bacterium]
MREIVFDTETTGLDPKAGHRLVEIGCVELFNRMPTGETFHHYVNPERSMPEDAFRIHGIGDDMLADKPKFAAVAPAFVDFIGDAPLVAHNASFDMNFINAELTIAGLAPIPVDRAVDTVAIARRKFPGSPASLDALAKRFDIDLSARDKHGALLDASILAAVYLELMGGREPGLHLAADGGRRVDHQAIAAAAVPREARAPRPHAPSAAELAAHAMFLDNAVKDPIWRR